MTLCLVFPSCIMQAMREAMKEAPEMEAQQNFDDDEDDEMQEAGEVLHTEDRSFAEPTLDNPEPTVGIALVLRPQPATGYSNSHAEFTSCISRQPREHSEKRRLFALKYIHKRAVS